ncbi:hypothetical protein L7F22_047624 [Adiantum nelumboides]|nr:hypothetical protein [Adiantum nelumboides]
MAGVRNFCTPMEGNSRCYSAREVGTNRARCKAVFLVAQAGILLQVPAAWFGEAWAIETYGDKHEEVFFFGVIEKFHAQIQKFTCQFEGDSRGYPATWDDLSSYIVRNSMSYNSPKKSVQVSVNFDVNDCTPCNVVLNQGGGGCEVLNLSVNDAHDALNWDGQGSIPHVDNEGSPTLDEAIPPARGRGRPPKSRKRGRPKGSSMHTSTNPSLESTRNIGRPCKQKRKSHAGGRPGTSASPYEEASDDDDNDEHASEGEGVECGDDDALEADGPVLDDSPEADCEFVDVVPPEWRSGDKMEQEPPGTFWPLLAFNDLVGPDLGHVPREFSEFHLFLMLFSLDLIDHIINETNMYANLQRELSFHVVANLVKYFPRQGHHVFFDRYFTSVKLLEHLRSEGQGGTGTYVCNRKHFPGKEMLNLGKQARGTSRFAYCRKQGVIACSWIDKKEIFFASNCFGMHKGEVTRMVADGKKMLVLCPDLAIEYNECKAGCDVFDSMVLGHGYGLQTTMHGWKWWHALFWGLMDSVFTNAWIIWKDLYGSVDTSRFDFMLHLHDQLVNNAFRPYVCKRPVVEDVYNGQFPMRLHDSTNVLPGVLLDFAMSFASYSNARSFLSDVLFAFLLDVLFARCYTRFCQLFSCQDYGCMVVQLLPGVYCEELDMEDIAWPILCFVGIAMYLHRSAGYDRYGKRFPICQIRVRLGSPPTTNARSFQGDDDVEVLLEKGKGKLSKEEDQKDEEMYDQENDEGQSRKRKEPSNPPTRRSPRTKSPFVKEPSPKRMSPKTKKTPTKEPTLALTRKSPRSPQKYVCKKNI